MAKPGICDRVERHIENSQLAEPRQPFKGDIPKFAVFELESLKMRQVSQTIQVRRFEVALLFVLASPLPLDDQDWNHRIQDRPCVA